MNALRILGLDDDNHSPTFRCEDGTIFNTYKELIDFLSKPHECQVEVKMFAIIDDIPEGFGLADYSNDEIDDMFYALEGIAAFPEGMIEDLVFELFWAATNRYWY
jgi:hypothetical protein